MDKEQEAPSAHQAESLPSRQCERLADFIQECGMLRHTPRSGYAFLGSGRESVAEHSYRTTVIGYVLARLAEADVGQVMQLCLFHDLHEARTGDFNYVNHRYNTCRAREALADAVEGTGLEEDILAGFAAFEARDTLEARLARDADQLDLMANLRVELDRGNAFAAQWLDNAVQRLRTPWGRELGRELMQAPSSRWWYARVESRWWVERR